MELSQLAYFRAVARTEHFTRAAEELVLLTAGTPSALSDLPRDALAEERAEAPAAQAQTQPFFEPREPTKNLTVKQVYSVYFIVGTSECHGIPRRRSQGNFEEGTLMAEHKLLTISEMAYIHGITRTTLIYYDKIGLFQPETVDENGYRYYSPTQIPMLREICFLRSIGIKTIY